MAMLVADHLSRVEADLTEAKWTLLDRLRSLVSRLPAGDPDRGVLEACIEDLRSSIVREQER